MSVSNEQREELAALVAPWLPGAVVEDANAETSCGCYSEWTTESTRFYVTFRAPRPAGETTMKLSKLVGLLEGIVRPWAQAQFEWQGCECCCGEDNTDELGYLDVRVIPAKAAPQLPSASEAVITPADPLRPEGSQ